MSTKYVDKTIDVRAIRKQLHISQEELAHRVGVSGRSINRWEGGKGNPPIPVADKMRELVGEVPNNTNSVQQLKIILEVKFTADAPLIRLLEYFLKT